MRTALHREHRRALESAIAQARGIAEDGARKALQALTVGAARAGTHLSDAQIKLRVSLRAHGRQLGDVLHPDDRQDIGHLVVEIAYEHWHRMLFARFLAENSLLLHPDSYPVSLQDCKDDASTLIPPARSEWEVAGRYAAAMLPSVFRPGAPVLALEMPLESEQALERLLQQLPDAVFAADDSLGWSYQFWQAKRKDEVNASGSKIGADELPAVTQLFTEDYMVDFLLDNTLGAWHAGKVFAANPKLAETAQCEDELRQAVTLPGCPWKYLRFIKDKDGKWTPAAGTFDGWPKMAKKLKCLDPCMGSGHFVVAMFERLVALRMAEEKLDEAAVVAAVIRDNLFGLEIDPRCTQIGAFNLALAAWRRVGHRPLPAMNLACSGLAPNAEREDWLKLAGDSDRLQRGMVRLYTLFKDAPTLGSLINPRATGGDLVEADFHELQPLLEKALAQEAKDDTAHELAVTASGLAKAAEILAGQFTLIATNVPYLGRGKQDNVLKEYSERVHSDAKADLATCFVERCLTFCSRFGMAALVTPQNWWFSSTYKTLRREILTTRSLHFAATLGEEAWQSFGDRGPFAGLLGLGAERAAATQMFAGLDALPKKTIEEKIEELGSGEILVLSQSELCINSDFRITVAAPSRMATLEAFAKSYQGIKTGDDEKICRCFWEFAEISTAWRFYQSSVSDICLTGGMELVLYWDEDGNGLARKQGISAWEKSGVLVCLMRDLPATRYFGHVFSSSVSPLVITNESNLLPIWAFCSSSEFQHEVRKIDRRVCVTNANILKVPFDLAHWQKVAANKYPHGLPKPFSSNPTQWLFNGYPKDSDEPLQVAVARLLGYQWPRQTGSSFSDCPALKPDSLEKLTDGDGIVCLPTVRGEPAAVDRLRTLLARAFGADWSAAREAQLLTDVGCDGMSLVQWLRDKFFEQHVARFHKRPFIWHVWDGHKEGFSALLNYHTLTREKLQTLIHTYLGDWITLQRRAVDAGDANAILRLAKAEVLKTKLEAILEGEAPYDIFVRWKALAQQLIGWDPDLNDGVRMNIRPFVEAEVLRIPRNKLGIKWETDRGKDVASAPWYHLGPTYGEAEGTRINDHHLTLAEKQAAHEIGQRQRASARR